MAFYLLPLRKRIALVNVENAFPHLSLKACQKIAKESFQNISIVVFEICWFSNRKKKLLNHITFCHEEVVLSRVQKGEGIVFLIGHQANWEVAFPAITSFGKGMGIAKPFKNNLWAYDLLQTFRQMNAGRVVSPQKGILEAKNALHNGHSVFFADHSYRRKSSYSYPFFGHQAFTSWTPALLAYRTQNPLVVIKTKRTQEGYEISFSPLLFPDFSAPYKKEVPKLMDRAMHILEKSISEIPEEWMWMHNRWKLKKKEI